MWAKKITLAFWYKIVKNLIEKINDNQNDAVDFFVD